MNTASSAPEVSEQEAVDYISKYFSHLMTGQSLIRLAWDWYFNKSYSEEDIGKLFIWRDSGTGKLRAAITTVGDNGGQRLDHYDENGKNTWPTLGDSFKFIRESSWEGDVFVARGLLQG